MNIELVAIISVLLGFLNWGPLTISIIKDHSLSRNQNTVMPTFPSLAR